MTREQSFKHAYPEHADVPDAVVQAMLELAGSGANPKLSWDELSPKAKKAFKKNRNVLMAWLRRVEGTNN